MSKGAESQEYSPYPTLPPIEDEEFRFMTAFLRGKQIPTRLLPGSFHAVGTFDVESKDEGARLREGYTELWTLGLLSLKPEEHSLVINTNGLIEVKARIPGISDSDGPIPEAPIEFFISPASVWFAKKGDNKEGEVVGESGVVVSTNNIFKQLGEFKALNGIQASPEDILRTSLEKAARGERPDFTTRVPFARVPDAYTGQKLTTITISKLPIRGPRDPRSHDVVVIDKDRTLVPRIIDFPLHPSRWQD